MLGTLMPRRERPLRLFGDFDREMTEMMNRFFGPTEAGWKTFDEFRPLTNLAETETAYEVTLDLPGVKPEEVRVEMRNGDLWVTGEKKEEKEEKGKTFHRVERTYGRFERLVPLPGTVNEERIEAAYKDGVLKVTLPKAVENKAHRIEVK